MAEESVKAALTVIHGGSGEHTGKEPGVTEESLELVQAFIRIASADDRRKVIDLATGLAQREQ